MLQFYPDGAKQAELITTAALRVGFSGGLVVDYPNSTRAKKYFLVLVAGCLDGISTSGNILARFESLEADALKSVRVDRRSKARYEGKKLSMGQRLTAHSGHKHPKGKAWILKEKNSRRDAEEKRFLRIANTREESGKTGCREYRAAYFFSRFR